jgi:hypothetical protein
MGAGTLLALQLHCLHSRQPHLFILKISDLGHELSDSYTHTQPAPTIRHSSSNNKVEQAAADRKCDADAIKAQ